LAVCTVHNCPVTVHLNLHVHHQLHSTTYFHELTKSGLQIIQTINLALPTRQQHLLNGPDNYSASTRYLPSPRICSTFIYIHRNHPQPYSISCTTSHITNTHLHVFLTHTYPLISAIPNFTSFTPLSPSPSFLIASYIA
jgi:hypothetical protein